MSILFKSTDNVSRQTLLLTVSVIFLLIDGGFLFFEFSVNLLWVLVISFAVLFIFNFFAGAVYDLTVEDEIITAKNLWRKKVFNKGDLQEIKMVDFILYYPLNPYVRFKFTDERRVVTTIPDRLKIYLKEGGVKKYLADLKKAIDG